MFDIILINFEWVNKKYSKIPQVIDQINGEKPWEDPTLYLGASFIMVNDI